MKTIRLAALAALTGLAVSCGSATLLDTVQTEVTRWGTSVPSPTVSPSSGAYRLTTDVPTVTLTANSAPTRLFYTTNGTAPVYNTVGNNQYPTTQRTDMDTLGAFTVPISITAGVNAVRAVAWRSDGKVSAEASATYRVVGDGGVVWASTDLPSPGETRAVATGLDSTHYAGGWTTSTGVTTGFIARFSSNGQRITTLLLPPWSRVNGIAVTSSGNLIVVGTLLSSTASYDFGNGKSGGTPALSSVGFAAVYSPNLVCQWVSVPTRVSEFNAVAVYNDMGTDRAAIAATLQGAGTTMFGSQIMYTLHSGSNGMLFWIDTTSLSVSSLYLAESGQATGTDAFQTVAIDQTTDRIAVGGWFDSGGLTQTYGGGTATGNSGYRNPLVVVGNVPIFSFSGVWLPSVPTATNAEISTLAWDSSDNILAGGIISGTPTSITGFSASSTGTNAFLVTLYYSNGAFMDISGPVGLATGDTSIRGIVKTTSGTYFAGTTAAGTSAWSGLALTGAGTATPFLGKVSGNSVVSWLRTPISTANDMTVLATGMDSNAGNRFLVGGAMTAGTSVDFGAGTQVTGSGSGPVPFIVQVLD